MPKTRQEIKRLQITPIQPQKRQELGAYRDFIARAVDSSMVLVGYSMGARVALDAISHTEHHPKALILISGTAGLTSKAERHRRYARDLSLADQIRENGVSTFLKGWRQHPLISTQSNASVSLKKQMASIREQHTADGLASALTMLSPGCLPARWSILKTFKFPVLLITGQLDQKYKGLAKRIQRHVPHAEWTIIDGSGHAPHLEKPILTARTIRQFIETLRH